MVIPRDPKTKDELNGLIAEVFSAHVFDYSFTAKDALVDAIWPVLADVWEDGHADFEYMPNPYRDDA